MTERGVAIVTGGASGIGLAAARALMDEGWQVLVVDLGEENLEAVDKILGPAGDRVWFERLDVSNEDDVVRVVKVQNRAQY